MRFSANFSPPRRAAPRAAAPLLPRGTTTATGLASLVYAVAGAASGVASGLASQVAAPLASRCLAAPAAARERLRAAPSDLLASTRDLARRLEPLVDETVERLAVCVDYFFWLPGATTSYHQQMLAAEYAAFDFMVQQEQRAAGRAPSSSSFVAPQWPRRHEPTLFRTMALSAVSSRHRAAVATFEADEAAVDAASSPRSLMISTLPAEEGAQEEATTANNNDDVNNYDPYELPAGGAEALASNIAEEVEKAAAEAALAAAAAAEAKAAAERAAARNGNSMELAAEAFLDRAVPVCLARVAAGLLPLPEKKELELEEEELEEEELEEEQQQVAQSEQPQPQPRRTVAVRQIGGTVAETPWIEVLEFDDWNEVVEREEQQQVAQPEQPQPQPRRTVAVRQIGGTVAETPWIEIFEFDDWNEVVEREEQQGLYDSDDEAEAMEVEVDDDEDKEPNTLPSSSSSSSPPPPPPSAPISVFDPSRMPASAEVLSVIVGRPKQRKSNTVAFYSNVVGDVLSKINGGGGGSGEDSSTRSVLSSRSGSDAASLSSASSTEELSSAASSSNDASTALSRPPLPPAHAQAMASLRASVSIGRLDPADENYSVEAIAAGRHADSGRLHLMRTQQQLKEQRLAAGSEISQQEVQQWQLEDRQRVERELALIERDSRESDSKRWAADFERRGREVFDETVEKLQLDHARKRAEAQKYFFDDNPFDALNLGILLFEGQDSVCADFFKRIGEEEREETEESRRVAAASSYRLLVLEEERGDFYRNLPDAEKYILSKKEHEKRK